MDAYRDQLNELERLVSEYKRLGPVLILGDFNAHLGILAGPHGRGESNQQGLLLKDLINRCCLHVLSQSERSSGPGYTFWNSVTETTVDYIIGTSDAATLIQRCYTHDQISTCINSSDHLPLSAMLSLHESPHSNLSVDSQRIKQVDWRKACNCESLETIRVIYQLKSTHYFVKAMMTLKPSSNHLC